MLDLLVFLPLLAALVLAALPRLPDAAVRVVLVATVSSSRSPSAYG